jgi:hypothetical protein
VFSWVGRKGNQAQNWTQTVVLLSTTKCMLPTGTQHLHNPPQNLACCSAGGILVFKI